MVGNNTQDTTLPLSAQLCFWRAWDASGKLKNCFPTMSSTQGNLTTAVRLTVSGVHCRSLWNNISISDGNKPPWVIGALRIWWSMEVSPFPNGFSFLPPGSLLQAEVCDRLHQKIKAALNLLLGCLGSPACTLPTVPKYTEALFEHYSANISFFPDLQKVH